MNSDSMIKMIGAPYAYGVIANSGIVSTTVPKPAKYACSVKIEASFCVKETPIKNAIKSSTKHTTLKRK